MCIIDHTRLVVYSLSEDFIGMQMVNTNFDSLLYEDSSVMHWNKTDLCYVCLVFIMLSRLFIALLWSPAGKGMTSCL